MFERSVINRWGSVIKLILGSVIKGHFGVSIKRLGSVKKKSWGQRNSHDGIEQVGVWVGGPKG